MLRQGLPGPANQSHGLDVPGGKEAEHQVEHLIGGAGGGEGDAGGGVGESSSMSLSGKSIKSP